VTDLDQQIIALADQGLRAVDIAQRLGLSKTCVCTRMSRLTNSGALRKAFIRKGSADNAKGRVNVLRSRYGVRVGNVGAALMQLNPAQTEWLFEQVPPGMTLSEYLVVLAKDVYAEDHGE
jgi:transposase